MACRQATPAAGNTAGHLVKIQVADTGFYRITLADLQRAGLDINTLDRENLALRLADTAVPILIEQDSLIFYGQAPDSPYTAVRSYLLQAGSQGEVMPVTAVQPATLAPRTPTQVPQQLRLEENHLYLPQARGKMGGNGLSDTDLWFWDTLGQKQKLTLTIQLPAISDGPATLQLNLWGATHNPAVENDHDFDLIVNGQVIETIRWDGETEYTSETQLPVGSLRPGNNTIVLDNEVEGASFLDIMHLNWLALNYTAPTTAVNDRLSFTQATGPVTLTGFSGRPWLFNISNGSKAPHLLTGWECQSGQACLSVQPADYIVAIGPSGFHQPAAITPVRTSTWRNTTHQADLLIITTDELAPALAPLVAARQAQGLAVALVPVAEIYDAFGFGEATPDSIQAFVQYATTQWQPPRPRYLFLVGEASIDYRNYLGQNPPNLVPPFLVDVEFSGETVSDSRLADIDGDTKPDLAVGRWPVDNVRDVESLVERTLAYEAGAGDQPPNGIDRAIFATDGTDSQFADIATRLWQNAGFPANTITLLNGSSASEVATEWNQGAWLTTYIGHGSLDRWGKDGVFDQDAVSQLKAERPPIVLQLTCLTGLFALTDQPSLSETLLQHPQGPVLLVAATSLTLSSHQEPFAAVLLQALSDPAVERIGDAFQQAKAPLDVTNSGLREISDTFLLFGDPSTRIVRPKA